MLDQKNETTTIQAKALAKALGIASQVVDRRSKAPALLNVAVTIKDGECAIRATNLDEFVTAACEAEGPDMAFMVQPGILTHLLRHGGPSVAFGIEAGQYAPVLTVMTGDLSARINLNQSIDDMPADPVDLSEYDEPTAVDAKDLLYTLAAVTPTISTEETRYYLNGCYMHAGPDGCLRMVSTDGHRLTRMDIPGLGWGREGVILPRGAIARLRKYLRGVDQVQVSVAAAKSLMRFEAPGWTLAAKLIDGAFPNYERVIAEPQGDFDVSLTGDAIAALPMLGAPTAVHIHPDAGRMWVMSPETGEVSIPITGKGGLCGISLKYLRALCPRGDAIRILGDSSKDGRSVHEALIVLGAEERLLRVVMPMRV